MSERIKRNYLDKHECVWVDSENIMHVDAVKMCKVLGFPPTRENQDTVEAVAREIAEEQGVPASVINDLL